MIYALCVKTYFINLFRSITEFLLHIKQFNKWKIQFFLRVKMSQPTGWLFVVMIQQTPQRAASNCLEVMSFFPSLFFLAFCQSRLVQASKPALLAASIYQQYQIILLCQIMEWIYKSTMGSRTKDTMLWWNSFRSKALATQVEAVKLETSNWKNEHIIYNSIRWRVYTNFSLIFLIYVI